MRSKHLDIGFIVSSIDSLENPALCCALDFMMESLNKTQMNVESLCPKPCYTLDYFGEESLDYKL